jgi:uncharacterized protein YjhX (UPF0386 family)
MSKTNTSQRLLNWLTNEKLKDQRELDREKEKMINQIKGIKRETLFPKPVKVSLWKRIKTILLGQ